MDVVFGILIGLTIIILSLLIAAWGFKTLAKLIRKK